MQPETLENMQFFVGKVCSIITSSMNRAFDEKISREHFVIYVGEITNDGIWGHHPNNTDLVSFFCMDHVISIHIEEVLDPNNPAHKKMIDEYEKKTGKKISSDLIGGPEIKEPEPLLPIIEKPPDTGPGDATFVDIKSLEQIAENTRRAYKAYQELN